MAGQEKNNFAADQSYRGMTAVQDVSKRIDPLVATLCVQALQNLRTALSQAMLYAEGTPQYVKAIEAAHGSLSRLTDGLSVLELSIHRGVVIVNARELEVPVAILPAIAAIERFFCKVGLYSFRFERGLRATELGSFLYMLAWNKFGSTGAERVNALLIENGIRCASVIDSTSSRPRASIPDPSPVVTVVVPPAPPAAPRPASSARNVFTVPPAPLAPPMPAVPPAPASGMTPAVPRRKAAHSSTVIMPSLSGALDLKPTLEGRIEEVGFLNVLRLAGGKDGLLSLHTPNGEARVAVKARTIISASYAGVSGIEALVEISEILSGPFAYLAGAHDIPKHIEVKISELEVVIQRYKEGERPQKKEDVDFFE